jgi:predicted amidophosphoribosyltransferase
MFKMRLLELICHSLTTCPCCGCWGGRPLCDKCWDHRLVSARMRYRAQPAKAIDAIKRKPHADPVDLLESLRHVWQITQRTLGRWGWSAGLAANSSARKTSPLLSLRERSFPVSSSGSAPTARFFPHSYLWRWDEDAAWVGDLIHGLKDGYHRQTFRDIAQMFFLCHRRLIGACDARPVFIPAPPRKPGRQDHAGVLAEELAKVFKGSVWAVLCRRDSEAQKRKALAERRTLGLIAEPSAAEFAKNSKRTIVFVDDIVTSGATAGAAFLALGRPKNFAVWSIAYRPRIRSCASSKTPL